MLDVSMYMTKPIKTFEEVLYRFHPLPIHLVSFFSNFQVSGFSEYGKSKALREKKNSIGELANCMDGAMYALVAVSDSKSEVNRDPAIPAEDPEYKKRMAALLQGNFENLVTQNHEKAQRMVNQLLGGVDKLAAEVANELEREEGLRKELRQEVEEMKKKLQQRQSGA